MNKPTNSSPLFPGKKPLRGKYKKKKGLKKWPRRFMARKKEQNMRSYQYFHKRPSTYYSVCLAKDCAQRSLVRVHVHQGRFPPDQIRDFLSTCLVLPCLYLNTVGSGGSIAYAAAQEREVVNPLPRGPGVFARWVLKKGWAGVFVCGVISILLDAVLMNIIVMGYGNYYYFFYFFWKRKVHSIHLRVLGPAGFAK